MSEQETLQGVVLLVFTVFIIFLLAIVYSLYKEDKNCFALSVLQKEYRADFSKMNPPKFIDEIVLFKSSNTKFHYVNGLRTGTNNDGLFCKGGFIYPWIKPFFIPWSALTKVGEKRFWFVKKDIYELRGLDTQLVISKKHGID